MLWRPRQPRDTLGGFSWRPPGRYAPAVMRRPLTAAPWPVSGPERSGMRCLGAVVSAGRLTCMGNRASVSLFVGSDARVSSQCARAPDPPATHSRQRRISTLLRLVDSGGGLRAPGAVDLPHTCIERARPGYLYHLVRYVVVRTSSRTCGNCTPHPVTVSISSIHSWCVEEPFVGHSNKRQLRCADSCCSEADAAIPVVHAGVKWPGSEKTKHLGPRV